MRAILSSCFMWAISILLIVPAYAQDSAVSTSLPQAGDTAQSANNEQANADAAGEGPVNQAELVAIFHLNVDGMKNESADGSLEMTLAKAVSAQGHRAVSPQEAAAFLESPAGKEYANCLSVSCSAKAGKTMGVTMVVSGNILRIGETTKANLQLISTEKESIVASDQREVPKGEALEPVLGESIAVLFEAIKPKPVVVEDIPEPGETPEQKADKEERFYKGTLTTIGPLEIIPKSDRVGVVLGYRRLGVYHYVHVAPEVDLRFFPDSLQKEGKLKLGFGIPLNLELFAGVDGNGDGELDKFDNAGIPRKEDWDHPRDYAKLIRYIQWGRKEDNLYVNVNRTFAASIGHGIVLKRYIPNLDYFTTRVSGEVDWYSRYGGLEFYTNDMTKFNIIGSLFFIKPGSFFSDNWMWESLSFGFTYHTDWDAPRTVLNNRQNDDGSYIYDPVDIHFLGGDVELKIVKWPVEMPKVDVKLYADYTKWLDNGSGVTVGSLGRFNLYTVIRQAFRIRVEFRAYQDNYIPSYFDPFYEIMKYKYFSEHKEANNRQQTQYNVRTKYAEFANRPSDFNHVGGYFEFSYALLDYFGLTFAFDGASGEDNGNFLFHIEVPATKYFQFAATYYKANVDTVKNVFDPVSGNTMMIALARLRPIQLLAFQFGVRRTTQVSEVYFPNLESVWDLKADLDISWEF